MVFWFVVPGSLLAVYQHFGIFIPVILPDDTQRTNPEDHHLFSHRHENLHYSLSCTIYYLNQ
jgi:hypothetical protein